MGLEIFHGTTRYPLHPSGTELKLQCEKCSLIEDFVFNTGKKANLVAKTVTTLVAEKISLIASVVPAQGTFVDNRGENLEMGTVAFEVANAQAPCRSRCTQYRGSCPGLSQDRMSLTYNLDYPNKGAQATFEVNVDDSFNHGEAECLR